MRGGGEPSSILSRGGSRFVPFVSLKSSFDVNQVSRDNSAIGKN